MLNQEQLNEINALFDVIRNKEKAVKKIALPLMQSKVERSLDFSRLLVECGLIISDFMSKSEKLELKKKTVKLSQLHSHASEYYMKSLIMDNIENYYKTQLKEKEQIIFKLIDEKKELEKQIETQEEINKF